MPNWSAAVNPTPSSEVLRRISAATPNRASTTTAASTAYRAALTGRALTGCGGRVSVAAGSLIGCSRVLDAHSRQAWMSVTRMARAPISHSSSMSRLASRRGTIARTADQPAVRSGETVGDSKPGVTATACSTR